MPLSRIYLGVLCVAVLCCSSCAWSPLDPLGTAPRGKPVAAIGFAHLRAVPLDVVRIDVRSEVGRQAEQGLEPGPGQKDQRPSEDFTFIEDPEMVLVSYLKNRFTASGQDGALSMVVADAQVQKSLTQGRLGLRDIERYDVMMRLQLAYDGGVANTKWRRSLSIQKPIYVSKYASITQRERKQLKGMEMLFQDIDQAVNKALESIKK